MSGTIMSIRSAQACRQFDAAMRAATWLGAIVGAALWLVAVVVPAVANAAPAPGDHNGTLQFEGLSRTFIVHVPPQEQPATGKTPAVIMLHGAGGSGRGAISQTGWNRTSDAEGFLVVYPDAEPLDPAQPAGFLRNPRLWNDGRRKPDFGSRHVDDVGFISALIDYLEKNYNADPERVFVTGFSNGSAMALRVGVELAPRVAAVAGVSGELRYQGRAMSAPVPMLFIIGDKDPLNPIDGGEVKLPWGPPHNNPPVAQTLAAWRAMLGCGADASIGRIGPDVTESVWSHCARGGAVEYYTVANMGHAWPGGTSHLPERLVGPPSRAINACEVIWSFFKPHRRSAARG
jgi:polyhydroxybutyrate depolymerase